MPPSHGTSLKAKLLGIKENWSRLTFDQRANLSAMIALLTILPLGVLLSLSPIKFLTGRASAPATPPVTSPVTPPDLSPTSTPVLPTPTEVVTLTPTVVLTATPTLSPTPIIELTPTWASTPTPTNMPTSTPTVAVPPGNSSPAITTSMFKSGRVRKYMERDIEATDRDGDEMTLSATNLPPGLILSDCAMNQRQSKASQLRCSVAGIPTQTGIYASTFLVRDIYGKEAFKTIYFTILP